MISVLLWWAVIGGGSKQNSITSYGNGDALFHVMMILNKVGTLAMMMLLTPCPRFPVPVLLPHPVWLRVTALSQLLYLRRHVDYHHVLTLAMVLIVGCDQNDLLSSTSESTSARLLSSTSR